MKAAREFLAEASKQETFVVHVAIGEEFDDVYVTAKNEKEAIEKAKKKTRLKNHKMFSYAKFVV